jgi:hypothetical protein
MEAQNGFRENESTEKCYSYHWHQQIQLRTEGKENGDLVAVAP